MSHYEKKMEMRLGYSCNNNCAMCFFSEELGTRDMKTDEIKKNISMARKKGVTSLRFTGGEPTIRKDFLQILSYASRIGINEMEVQTNGRMFFYEDFVKKIYDISRSSAKVRFLLPIYGHNGRLHDSITRSPGSFEQTVAGIKNLMKYDIEFNVKTVILKQNYKNLPDIVDFLSKMGIKSMNISSMCIRSGRSTKETHSLPKFKDVMPYLHKMLIFAKDINFKIDIHSIPLCIIPEYVDMVNENIFETTLLGMEPDCKLKTFKEVKNRVLDFGNKMKPVKCKKCKLSSKCGGIWRKYFEIYGDVELKPFR